MDERNEIGRRMSRSARRHHRLRMFARALRSMQLASMTVDEREYFALRQLDQLKRCSCWMCGNPRRFEGERTVQERRRLGSFDLDGGAPVRERS